MQKLILIDSDETLRRTDGSISERTKEVIRKLIEEDYYVVICTGRPRYHTIEIMKEAGTCPIIISSNGAEIFDTSTNEIIASSFIDVEECYWLIDYAISYDLRLIISFGSHEYVTRDLKNDNQILLDLDNYKEQLIGNNIYQCMIVDDKVEEVKKLKDLVENSKTLKIKNGVSSNQINDLRWFTLGNPEATKGSALIKLANHLNIPINDTIAIGNDYNDIPMLKEAGFSICVDNALDEVKSYADYITLSNDEDGVALVLEKVLRNEF